MAVISYFNNLPDLAEKLNAAAQSWVNEQAGSLSNKLAHNVPSDALAAPAVRDGFYVRTPGDSGYDHAVSKVEALFARPENLFPSSVMELFVGSGSLVAPDTRQVFDPRIVPEVPQPPDLYAYVGNCTGWAGQAEYGEVGAPFVLETVNDFEPDTSSFEEIWRSL